MLTLGSMFAGIGGLELGFESTGCFETKWQVEIDEYANQVLRKHWPSVVRWKNVKTFPPRPVSDWQCDVIGGGFPCQDLLLGRLRKRQTIGTGDVWKIRQYNEG